MVYHTELRWISRAHKLKRFISLSEEIKFLMVQKGKPMADLDDKYNMNNLTFITELTRYLEKLYIKLQSTNQIISYIYMNMCIM